MKDYFQIPQNKQSLLTRGIKTSPSIWLKQKQDKDSLIWKNQQKLWIIENKVYDLKSYYNSHPGGKVWIELTKGQDITEHFIIHHLRQEKARAVLDKYYIKNAQNPQRPRFTFQQFGLYKKIKNTLMTQYSPQYLQDSTKSTLCGIFFLVLWSLLVFLASFYESIALAVISGILLYPIIGIAHNFIHMKHHIFRYLFLLTGFTHREWQIMHCISHHTYSNTLLDFEIQGLEPLAYYLKIQPKNNIICGIIKQLIFPFATLLNMIMRVTILPLLHKENIQWYYLVPLVQIIPIYIINGNISISIKLFCLMHISFSTFFMKINLIGHRTGKEWTQGHPQIRDFGEHQIRTCTDIQTNNQSGFVSFLLYAGFNYHTSHHLFPTVDNYYLPLVDKILREEAKKVGIGKNEVSNPIIGMYQVESNYYSRKQGKFCN